MHQQAMNAVVLSQYFQEGLLGGMLPLNAKASFLADSYSGLLLPERFFFWHKALFSSCKIPQVIWCSLTADKIGKWARDAASGPANAGKSAGDERV